MTEPASTPRPTPASTAADEPSDVRRLSGLYAGAIVAAVVTVLSVFISEGRAALTSPGALSAPHVRAEVGCADCHSASKPAAACGECHGPHPSTRAGHQEMRRQGKMSCITCHDSHRSDQGVALLKSGIAERYGNGWAVRSSEATGFRATKPVFVATVAASKCGGCHRLSDPRDAIFTCLDSATPGPAASRPTLCFDEHQTAANARKKKVARDGAWEAARVVLSNTPAAPASGRLGWLLLGLGAGGLVWTGRQLQLRYRKRSVGGRPTGGMVPAQVVRLPQINAATCLGCNACVDACPYNVIEMRSYIAEVARPDDCCGLTLCEQKCPNGSLVVREGEPIVDRPRVDEELQSAEVPGLFLAGDLTGLPLIKNAINQGAYAVRAIAKQLPKRKRGRSELDADVIVVGAGPAGLSAALEAKSQGLSVVVVEQGSVASSIQSFPRGKLVFDQPLDVPLVGELWLEESTKEELLSQWLRIVRRHNLDIREGTRVIQIAPFEDASGFRVQTRTEDGSEKELRGQRVVLAIGRRGTPRRLDAPIEDAALSQVFYGISDASSFAGSKVLVVGLGDSALEAAVALCHQPDTHVTVVHRGQDFRRGTPRNIAALKTAAERGKVDLRFETVVTKVSKDRVTLSTRGVESSLSVDATVVLIGALAPWPFLERIGIRRPTEGRNSNGAT